MLDRAGSLVESENTQAFILSEQGQLQQRQGKYPEAEALLRRSLALVEKALGTDHPSYGSSLHALAGVVSKQGRYPEAEALLRRSLAIDEKALGTDHPSYGSSLHALAGVVSKQGKYPEAEALLRRSLAIDEKALGTDHPSYGSSLHALAGVVSQQGKYPEAEALLRRSLALVEKALGTDHPSYGSSLHALAGVLESQGKYPEAEALLRRSLAIDEKALGTDHPSYGSSLHALAGVVSQQGKYPEAEALLRRSLALYEKALGTDHPSYGSSLHALAGVVESQGKYPEAEALLRRSLALYEKALGTDHPSYGSSLHALAGVVESQGKYPEAEALLRRSLAIDEKALGTDHPSYGSSLHALAGVVSQQGKYPEAEALLRRSLALVEKALGTDHPDYGSSLHALAGVLESQGKYPEAERFFAARWLSKRRRWARTIPTTARPCIIWRAWCRSKKVPRGRSASSPLVGSQREGAGHGPSRLRRVPACAGGRAGVARKVPRGRSASSPLVGSQREGAGHGPSLALPDADQPSGNHGSAWGIGPCAVAGRAGSFHRRADARPGSPRCRPDIIYPGPDSGRAGTPAGIEHGNASGSAPRTVSRHGPSRHRRRPSLPTYTDPEPLIGVAQSATFVCPLRRQFLGKPIAVAAPDLASSAAHLSRISSRSPAIEPPGWSPLQAAPGRRRLPERRAVSRGLALGTRPHVAALATPSARVRTRANRGTRQGLSRALRQSLEWAWFPVRRCRRRYGSTPQPWRAQAPTARDGCESAEVARPHLRSASRRWAGWCPLRCRMPGMQATARAHRRPARRYQGAGCVALAPSQAQPTHPRAWPAESRTAD
jgi:tetratricopeptide (TPR) repeat protein